MLAEKESRVAFWDNLKAVLIVLVVIGHCLYFPNVTENAPVSIFFIYSIHMPLFIFCSGLFVKTVKTSRIFAYLSLYVILKIFRFLFIRFALGGTGAKLEFFTEGGVPWFLLGMVIWLSLLRGLKNVKPRYVLGASLVLSLLVGFDGSVGNYLVLGRVFYFFPFFYGGHIVNREKLEIFIFKLKERRFKFLAGSLLLANLFILRVFSDDLLKYVSIFTGKYSYEALGFGIEGVLIRVLVYVYILIIGVAFMSFIPKGRRFFTPMGKRTLSIYFTHFFLIELYSKWGMLSFIQRHFPRKWLYLYVGQFILITFILSLPVLSKPFDKLMALTINLDKIKISKSES